MLKIKDNVDLQKLFNFGFELRYDCFYKKLERGYNQHLDYEISIYVNEDKTIFIEIDSTYGIQAIIPTDILFDLISAGLVEKVED